MANPLVAHLNSFRRVTLDEALACTASAGYDAVELCAHGDTGVRGRPAVERDLARHGLTASALSAHTDLATEEGLAEGVELVAWAADHGIGLVTSSLGGEARDARPDVPAARLERLRRLAALASAADGRGVVVALEVHGRAGGTGALLRPWVDAVDSPALRVKYDTANCEYYGGVAAVDDLPGVLDLVVNVDAKDKRGGPGLWDFPPPGEGHIDWPRLIAVLRDGGYVGPITVEVEFRGDPWPSADAVTTALRSAAATLAPLLS